MDKLSKEEHANIEGNISAMVQIGSVAGAALYVSKLDPLTEYQANSPIVLSSFATELDVSGLLDNSAPCGFSVLSFS